ncbi:MAG: GLUG motif-containing protein, partial [Planctomycetota bacterium]
IGGNPRLMLAHFKLTDNIDLTGVDLWPIGYRYPFTGTFDGNDHTISDFTYNVPGSYSAGIFGAIDGPNAVVKDLGITDPDIVVSGNAGALACAMYNGTISNCYMENGNISGGYSLGGLIGIMENGTISDCYVQGASIYGDRFHIGGLVGRVEAGTISGCYTTSCSVSGYHGAGGLAANVEAGATVTDCHSDSSVSGAYGYGSLDDCMSLGGLIGGNSGTVSNCHATGAVSGIVGAGAGGYFGGLIGNNGGTVSACYATGNISEGRFVMGGLVGGNSGSASTYGTISDCYATGNVTGIEYLGGLAGHNSGTITNSRAEGDVTSGGATERSVGGFVGHNQGIIDQSYAIGAVSGYDRVGGLAGTNIATDGGLIGDITDCYAMGSVSGNDKVGGLVGYIFRMDVAVPIISNCYSTGSVSGTTDVGGLIGNNNYGGTVTASFWDEQTSGQTTSDGGTRKTTAEMQTQTTFTDAGWDFVHIWDVCEGISYPKLIWQIPLLGDFVSPDGINMLDLAFLAAHWLDEDCNDLNGYCEGADLNRSGDVNFPDYGLLAQNWWKGLMPFVLDEDFETGDFTKYNWQQAGDANWVVVGDVVYEGSYSAKSGLISHNEQSVLQISLIIEDGSVSFYRKVSSESDEDYLRFYIDNQLQDGWSGEQDWSLQQYAITSGIHTLKWVYMKDASISSGSDCAWIDKITITGVMP